MSAQVERLDTPQAVTRTPWSTTSHLTGWCLVALGLVTYLRPGNGDPIWSAFLVVVGLVITRVAATPGMAILSVALGWIGVIGFFFGHTMSGLLFSVAAVAAAAASYGAYRAKERALTSPALAWAAVALGALGTILLTVSLAGGLLAFLSPLQIEAAMADTIAAAGAYSAALAVAFGAGAIVDRSHLRWLALLGIAAGGVAILVYLGLLAIAQG
ncbi:MAG: hypothetical protein U0822_00895 [Anaerolineae bacterium]